MEALNLPIPEDIIIHFILPKLPPRSLVRFQCVSKLWKSVISDPSFNISPKHIIHAIVYTDDTFKSLKSDTLSNPLRLEELHAPVPSNLGAILGSCNGLILFCNECDLFLWNPTTSYCEKVHKLDQIACHAYSFVPGFCYDDSLDDYIVLATFRQMSPGWNLPVISSTLKSKRWRRVSFKYDIDSIITGPIVNNKLHWLASPNGSYPNFGHPNTVVYFDAPSNAFKKLPSPNRIDGGEDDRLLGLGVVNDCLCLMRLDRGDVEVLIMKEYGVKESWDIMFRIPHKNKHNFWRVHMLFCSWNVDFIIFDTILKKLAYYPRTKTMEEIKIPNSNDWRLQVIPYVIRKIPEGENSFVSPSGYYWNEESDKEIASTKALMSRRFDDNLSDEE